VLANDHSEQRSGTLSPQWALSVPWRVVAARLRDQIGSIELGKQADLAVWRLSGLAHADIVDPVAPCARRPTSARPPVGGGSVGVHADRLLTDDEDELTADAMGAHRKLVGA
jgi:cytosine/adenosine deaminase-related metal-dependent hydrolase